MLKLFARKNKELDAKNNDELFNSLTVLQNEVGVSFDTKVIAITSVNDDELSAKFAKAYAEAYSRNGNSVLLIDANLYNPCLQKVLGVNSDVEVKDDKDYQLTAIDEKIKALCLNKEIYPSEIYKSGLVQKLIKENEKEFDHFIVLVPSVKDHKEVLLLNDVLSAILLVTQKNVTLKSQIFDAIQFFRYNKLPLAKTVIVK